MVVAARKVRNVTINEFCRNVTFWYRLVGSSSRLGSAGTRLERKSISENSCRCYLYLSSITLFLKAQFIFKKISWNISYNKIRNIKWPAGQLTDPSVWWMFETVLLSPLQNTYNLISDWTTQNKNLSKCLFRPGLALQFSSDSNLHRYTPHKSPHITPKHHSAIRE